MIDIGDVAEVASEWPLVDPRTRHGCLFLILSIAFFGVLIYYAVENEEKLIS